MSHQWRYHAADLIHAGVVLFVCALSTTYAVLTHDHSDNIWIVYGSAIAFAAGRAGAAVAQQAQHNRRTGDSVD